MRQSPSGKYVVRWREGARHRSRSFTSEADAARFDAEVKRRMELGDVVLSRSDVPTLHVEAVSWLAHKRGLSKSTERLYANTIEQQIDPELGDYNLLDLRSRVLETWLHGVIEKHGTRSAQIAYNVLSQILDRAARDELVPSNRLKLIPRPRHAKKIPIALTPKQVEALRTHFLGTRRPRNATLVSLIAYAGLRPPQEPLGLMWADLDGRKLHVRRRNVYGKLEDFTKQQTQRFVPLPEPVYIELQELRLADGRPEGLILPGRDGQPVSRVAWQSFTQQGWKRALEACELPAITPYDLRHTAASLMLASGVPLPVVARRLGHSIATCARIYAHLIDGFADEGDEVVSLDERIGEAREAA